LALILTSYDALQIFAAQLERNIEYKTGSTKVVITPSPVKEKGVVVKVSLLKTMLQTEPKLIHASRMLRIRVSVAGTAESMTGLRQALDAIEALDGFFTQSNLRLETIENGTCKGVPNSRILQTVSQEDSFFDSPDSTEVQEIQDDRIITITIPTGV
jgi:hypothetical protein